MICSGVRILKSARWVSQNIVYGSSEKMIIWYPIALLLAVINDNVMKMLSWFSNCCEGVTILVASCPNSWGILFAMARVSRVLGCMYFQQLMALLDAMLLACLVPIALKDMESLPCVTSKTALFPRRKQRPMSGFGRFFKMMKFFRNMKSATSNSNSIV